MEAAALLVAGAITGGYVHIPQGPAHSMGMLLMKLQKWDTILINPSGIGIKIKATKICGSFFKNKGLILVLQQIYKLIW